MRIYYLANSIYQFAYAFSLYRHTNGIFVLPNKKKMGHFQSYLKDFSKLNPSSDFALPQAIILPRERYHELKGILVFFANTIDPSQDYSQSITCFHEHGTSDKRYEGGKSIAVDKLKKYDYLLLSGPKNKKRLLDTGVEREASNLIETGCLRFDDYLYGKYTVDEAAQALKIRDRSRKNILYAPTWKFGNGTFKEYASYLIDQLSEEYNLILRPHYHDRRYGAFLYWWSRLKGKKHVYFSKPQDVLQHDTYSAFTLSDLMLSDISSVIYEYLITGKPIILIENDFKERHQMPREMDIVPHVDLFQKGEDLGSLISKNLESAERDQTKYRELLDNCFYRTEGGAVAFLSDFLNQLREKNT